MKPELLQILQHALGVDKFGQGKMYRNRYVAGGTDADLCRELVRLGFMKEYKPNELSGGDPSFSVTPFGRQAMKDESPEEPEVDHLRRALFAVRGKLVEWKNEESDCPCCHEDNADCVEHDEETDKHCYFITMIGVIDEATAKRKKKPVVEEAPPAPLVMMRKPDDPIVDKGRILARFVPCVAINDDVMDCDPIGPDMIDITAWVHKMGGREFAETLQDNRDSTDVIADLPGIDPWIVEWCKKHPYKFIVEDSVGEYYSLPNLEA